MCILFSISYLTDCRTKTKKNKTVVGNIVGKWQMIKSEFECSTSQQANLLNSFSTVNATQVVFKFTDSSFQIFYGDELRSPVPYKFEGDTLIVNYPDETPPFVSKSFVEFITIDKLILRETRKETNCVLISNYSRIE